jgi:hypothetical protein
MINKIQLMILLISMFLVGVTFFYLYKRFTTKFNFSEKGLNKRFFQILILIIFLILQMFLIKIITPLDKNFGIEFNQERTKLGIDTISEKWKIDKETSSNFKIQWWNSNPESRHFKKEIHLEIFKPKLEYDYYHNLNLEGTLVISKFNYSEKSFQYYYWISDNKTQNTIKTFFSTNLWPPTIKDISKSEFEKYLID